MSDHENVNTQPDPALVEALDALARLGFRLEPALLRLESESRETAPGQIEVAFSLVVERPARLVPAPGAAPDPNALMALHRAIEAFRKAQNWPDSPPIAAESSAA